MGKFRHMCIGIIYDPHTSDSWHRIENDIYSVKSALKAVKLPLPVACIFDTSRNDFVELDDAYKHYRTELLEKARSIFKRYLQDRRTQEIQQASAATPKKANESSQE
jgi:hypothetical protein